MATIRAHRPAAACTNISQIRHRTKNLSCSQNLIYYLQIVGRNVCEKKKTVFLLLFAKCTRQINISGKKYKMTHRVPGKNESLQKNFVRIGGINQQALAVVNLDSI